jgi:FAD synthetase
MKKVMLFGTFNIIHPGHLNVFRQAKKFGDKLIVVLARDETVTRLKNYNPHTEIERRHKLLQLSMVDEVILGDFVDKMKPIKDFKPDVICLGYDQEHFIDEMEAYIADNNLDIMVVRLKPYKPEQYKGAKFRENKIS